MSLVYLIRHGQAGTRDHYDTLSELGRRQARLLGEYLAGEKLHFKAAFSGGMARQNETGRQVLEAYARAGLPFPLIAEDAGWREFDLDHVYRALAPRLCETDAKFRQEYEAMMAEVRESRGDADAVVHRRWSPCDIQVVDAWIRGRFAYDGESWDGFRRRVASASVRNGVEGNVIVFTSATPTAVWAGRGLEIEDERLLRIAGVLYNASITTLRVKEGQVRLFSLNGVPHLNAPDLKTHR